MDLLSIAAFLLITLLTVFVANKIIARQSQAPQDAAPGAEHAAAEEDLPEHAKPAPSKEEEKKPSLKQLKKQAQKSNAKKKFRPKDNPSHDLYVGAFKNFGNQLLDFDFFLPNDDGLPVLAALEDGGSFRLFAIRDMAKEDFIQSTTRIDYMSFLSISVGPATRAGSYLLALGSGEKVSSVMLYEFTVGKDKITLQQLESAHLVEMHKSPFLCARLSKTRPGFLITCGDEGDTTVKLWRVGSGEPLTVIDTKQLKHYSFSQGPSLDFFCVAAWSPDFKVYQLTKKERLERVFEVTGHEKKALAVAFNRECSKVITCAEDRRVLLHVINEYSMGRKQVAQVDYKDATPHLCATEDMEKETRVAVASGQWVEVLALDGKELKRLFKIDEASSSSLSRVLFWRDRRNYRLYLLTCSFQDGRINVWRAGDE